MAQIHAKLSQIKIDGVPLKCVTSSISGTSPELVEITNTESKGFREYLSGGGLQGLTIDCTAQYLTESSVWGAPPKIVKGQTVSVVLVFIEGGNQTPSFSCIASEYSVSIDPKSTDVITYQFKLNSTGAFTLE